MVALKQYSLDGGEVGFIQLNDAFLDKKAHAQSIKDYLVAIRNNARQWSAHTKTRAEINRTGKKPHPQKGGGRSRQGDLAAPQYKGGGIVFGPRAKFDVSTRINKKERRAAIAAILVEKIKDDRVCVLQQVKMPEPKTKSLSLFFDAIQGGSQRVLVLGGALGSGGCDNLVKSLRNIPKKEYSLISQINGYSLARAQRLVVLESALEYFFSIFGASHE